MPYAGPVIDTHCHVFRARDLPVKQFLIQVKGLPEPVATAVARMTKGWGLGFLFRMFSKVLIALLPRSTAESYIEWAALLTRSNKSITDRMIRDYREVVLFAPLMMDMVHWMGGKQRSPAKQRNKMIRVMRDTMKKKPVMVHPFIAFDPERERQHGDSLSLVKDSIENEGFIGVKIYPPLGFRATDNADLAGSPDQVNDYVTKASSGTPVQDILDGWDKALDDLYKYCTDLDVPITAHCTLGGAGAYGLHADPRFWETVLQKYPTLRLNLAHFGEDLIDKKTQSWAWQIGALMNRYDHVYADTGAHETIYEAVTRRAYFVEMEKLFATFPKAPERYMYGTDWHMIIRHGRRYEGFYEEYSRHYDDWYANNNLDVKDFFFNNALEFLGLNVGDSNHSRLLQFYANNPKLIWSPAVPR